MDMQPVNNSDWDYLIVLDACRYDYFEQIYSDYLDGDLSKVKSRGSATPEWLLNTFKDKRYNYKYITANPYINKQGNALKDLVSAWNYEWYAGDKFTEINEAWMDEWDEEIGTVRPEKLKQYALEKIREDDGKTIIHFIQPHRPFISYEGDPMHNWAQRSQNQNNDVNLVGKLKNSLRPLWSPLFYNLPKRIQYSIRGFLGKTDQYREFAEQEGEKKVRDYYEKDLRMALEQISELNEKLEGDVVVTSDHGESFGEDYEWGHPIGSKNSVLIEVPWLEIK